MNQSMILVTAPWKSQKTFRLIPIHKDCPYNEMIFDREEGILAIVGKEKKQSFHMMAKLNDVGDVIPVKMGRREGNKQYAEERKTLETYYEYYIENPEEIETVVKLFALNAGHFDYKSYLESAYNK